MSSRFLVTTSHSVLLVDVRSGKVSVVHRGGGLYYGISEHASRYYVASRRRMVSSEVPAEDERGEILVLDAKLRHIDTLVAPFALRDMHEIAHFGGKLWIACSYEDLVVEFDGTLWQRWYPLGEPVEKPYDRYHLNSLYFEGESIAVLAHNRGPSALHFFDHAARRLASSLFIGVDAHNVWREDGEYFTCSSRDGRIVGHLGFALTIGGFSRGMAQAGGLRVVGVSELAERDERDFTSGMLKVYDDHWQQVGTHTLEHEGLVLDIHPYREP